MIRGLYTGASGMAAQQHRLDALSNNLANVNTTGYKRDTSVQKAFPELLIRRMSDDGVKTFPFGSIDVSPVVGKVGTGVEHNETYTVFTQGSLKQTENDFDLALEGKGFFAIETPQGERYTRNGSFHMTDQGMLVTKEGLPVLGENGPITIKKNNFVVDQYGRVWQNAEYADDEDRLVSMEENEWNDLEMVDTLKVAEFDRARHLKKQGSSLWMATEESGAAEIAREEARPKVRQGFLETSNVNPVTEMVQMIEVNRAYEANQRVIHTEDGMLDKLINQAVRL